MFSLLTRWNRRRVLRHRRIADAPWRAAISGLCGIAHLDAAERDRLRDLASLFLYEKSFEAAHDFELTTDMRIRIAVNAVLPVLNLGLDCYADFHAVVVYPDTFIVDESYEDDDGIMHAHSCERAGEAWDRGPVILSWADIEEAEPGYNVIIHEMAHKLDMLDGAVNGRPPLHAGMSQDAWSTAFRAAYDSHVAQVDAGVSTRLDEYAASDPGEFFAVTSEAFFETPNILHDVWPAVYEQLALYYRQQPLVRT